MAPLSPAPSPIASDREGTPLAYGVLGAIFHLDAMISEDEASLAAVNDLIWDWFGGELRWTYKTFDDEITPARRDDMDYIASRPSNLVMSKPVRPDDFYGPLFSQFSATDFEVAFTAGTVPQAASPFSYHFWSEIPAPSAGDLRALSIIHITVPESWPLDDFRRRVCEIAAQLRLRWGAAGLTYSTWTVAGDRECSKRVAAHAKRFIGYDIGEYIRLVGPFFERVRTVSWLTFLGRDLAAELRTSRGPIVATPPLELFSAGESLVIQAGAAPTAGDSNRLTYPAAYVEADSLIRPIRADSGQDMVFLGPWDEAAITSWLRRYERHLH